MHIPLDSVYTMVIGGVILMIIGAAAGSLYQTRSNTIQIQMMKEWIRERMDKLEARIERLEN